MSSSTVLGIALATILVALIVFAAVVLLIAYGIRRAAFAIKGEEYVPIRSTKQRKYEHQDIRDGATSESMENVLKHYLQTPVVGKYAQATRAALENADRKKAEYIAVLNSKFQPNSISWQKFASAADATQQAILQNCAALTNYVQTFDYAEYHRLDRAFKAATQNRGAPLDSTAAAKRQMLIVNLAEMEKLKASNEQLSVELDKLAIELGKLESIESGADTQKIVEEIRSLIQETQYYSQASK